MLMEHPLGTRSLIFRCAGIYGPGRVPHIATLRAGAPLAVPPTGYLNLIHVDDAAEIILQAERQLATPELLNVSDGQPVVRSEYYAEIARLSGSSSPVFSDPRSESAANQRAAADKRVCNQRLRERLHYSFRYPSYREGLAAIVAAESAS
jgi:nucleoside-diphosphate-sugar epimerase